MLDKAQNMLLLEDEFGLFGGGGTSWIESVDPFLNWIELPMDLSSQYIELMKAEIGALTWIEWTSLRFRG